MDVDSIDPGTDFSERIESAMESCNVCLPLIGAGWLQATDQLGRGRLEDSGDLVRMEIEAALSRESTRVIPLLLDGADMPAAASLPNSMAALSRIQAMVFAHASWGHDFERLVSILEPEVPATPAAAERGGRSEALVIGPYRCERLIGRGTLGPVYLARHAALNRKVAVRLLDEVLADDPKLRERFLRSANSAATFDHPNALPVLDAGEANGRLYVVVRYVGGLDIGAVVARNGALAPVRVAGIVTEAAAALDAAHERGLVHRHVRPTSVILATERGVEHAYLTGFTSATAGVADLHAGGTWPPGAEERMLTGVRYRAPEEIRGEDIGPACDRYGLGAIAWEALAGVPPFRRRSTFETMSAIVFEPPPSIRSVAPLLPEAVEPVLARALAKDPAERFPLAGTFAQALHSALDL